MHVVHRRIIVIASARLLSWHFYLVCGEARFVAVANVTVSFIYASRVLVFFPFGVCHLRRCIVRLSFYLFDTALDVNDALF